MRYKTLFRLLMKFLGVWFTCNGIVGVCGTLASVAMISMQVQRAGIAYQYSFGLVHDLVELALGMYLFFGGKWIVDKAIPSNRPYCHECGYDLTGAVGDVCNECGTPFRGEVAPTHG